MPTANPSDLLDKAPPRLRDPLLQPFRLKGLSLAQPHHEHQPRRHHRRGRAAQGALPALPRGEGQGRHRPHHVRRLLDGGARFELGRRPDRHVERRHHPRPAGLLVAHPRPWRRDHVPDLASRPARHLGRDELAADRGAQRDPRAPPSRHPARDGPQRHRPHHRRLRRRRRALQGGRARRLRDRDRRPSDRPVPVAAHQPAHRRLRRLAGEPRALRPDGARGHPQARSATTTSSASASWSTRTSRRASASRNACGSPSSSSARAISTSSTPSSAAWTPTCRWPSTTCPACRSRWRRSWPRSAPSSARSGCRSSTPRASPTSPPRAMPSPRTFWTWWR